MRIVLCEDQKILLDGLASSLGKDNTFEIVSAVSSAEEILPALRKTSADLVLSDIITTENKNFLDYVKDIKAELPAVKIVAITGFPDITFMETAKKVGVDSFVYKNISTEELVSVIKNTFSGYSVYPTSDRIKNMILSTLSDTELKILRMYCNGKERDEIATALYLSKSSIKAYISSILQKTGFSSIARVAIYAVSTGLIFTDNE
ncbi:MAG: response regulator transcription factor [Clostridia bacterium]|nr:response regulator transcription factor [Clostridia bacterium]